MPASNASVQRDGDALVFTGALDRAACPLLWADASKVLVGAQRIVLTSVTTVDSAGLALLAELAARLRAAYRLTSGLDFPGVTPTSK